MKIKSHRDGLAARFQETRLRGGEQVLAVYQGVHFVEDESNGTPLLHRNEYRLIDPWDSFIQRDIGTVLLHMVQFQIGFVLSTLLHSESSTYSELSCLFLEIGYDRVKAPGRLQC